MTEIINRLSEFLKANPVGFGPTDFPFRAAPPCDGETITKTELELGFEFPELLKEIYTKIANGGFGPGYGVMGVRGGFTEDQGKTIETLYAVYRQKNPEDPTWEWPEGLLPICHWGCVIYSAVDCLRRPHPVYFVDVSNKEPGAPMRSIIIPHKNSLEDWLRDWMDGKDLWAEVWGK